MDAVVETAETDPVLAAAVGVAVVGIVGSELLCIYIGIDIYIHFSISKCFCNGYIPVVGPK